MTRLAASSALVLSLCAGASAQNGWLIEVSNHISPARPQTTIRFLAQFTPEATAYAAESAIKAMPRSDQISQEDNR